MDWKMAVNSMLEDEITKIGSNLLPPNFSGDARTVRTVQESLAKVIDRLGEQSAAAQGLNKVITTAEKLRNSPEHFIYLIKDENANEKKGEIIGMLKVGRKHLFLFDQRDRVHEVEPLCVLDFYVLSERQRMGYGRRLYDHMLRDLVIMPWEMAIDGPSTKMEKFLQRNYGIDHLIRQNNNFAIAQGFFERPDHVISDKSADNPPVVSAAVGRFAAPKPASAIANVIHGGCNDEPSRRSAAGVRETGEAEADADAGAGAGAGGGESEVWQEEWREPSEEDYYEEEEQHLVVQEEQVSASVARPDSLPVPPPPAPHAFADAPPSRAAAAAAAAAAAVPAAGMPSAPHSAATTPGGRRDSQLTDRGHFDIKNYHTKLW